MESRLRERLERLGPVRALERVASGSPRVAVFWATPEPGSLKTISATMALARRGTSMLLAKRAVEAAMVGSFGCVSLAMVENDATLRGEMQEAGFRIVLREPDAQSRPTVDIAALRQRLHLSREQFAAAYDLDVESLRNWEAGRRDPGPVAAYLRAIENDPSAVLKALTGVSA